MFVCSFTTVSVAPFAMVSSSDNISGKKRWCDTDEREGRTGAVDEGGETEAQRHTGECDLGRQGEAGQWQAAQST